jgi:hypothetical protein
MTTTTTTDWCYPFDYSVDPVSASSFSMKPDVCYFRQPDPGGILPPDYTNLKGWNISASCACLAEFHNLPAVPAPPPPRPPPPPPRPPPPPPPPAAECQSCEIVLYGGNNNLGLQGTTALADGGRTGYCYRYPDEPQVIHYPFGSGLEPGMVCYMESTASSAYEWELVAACRCDTIISDDALVGSSQTGPAF